MENINRDLLASSAGIESGFDLTCSDSAFISAAAIYLRWHLDLVRVGFLG